MRASGQRGDKKHNRTETISGVLELIYVKDQFNTKGTGFISANGET